MRQSGIVGELELEAGASPPRHGAISVLRNGDIVRVAGQVDEIARLFSDGRRRQILCREATTDSAIEAIVSLVSAGTSTINNPFEMASKKDMRRADLVIPYQAPKPKETQELSSTLSSTLPMAVMLTRNRFIGWAAVIYSVQNWLGESEDQKKTATTPGYFNVTMSLVSLLSEDQKKTATTPGYFNVTMSLVSLLVAYLPLFLPPKLAAAATGTAPAAPLPLQ
ncbi:hypothetical protein HYQ46_003712 [Verticillium longisporum]|nr:hypothetical protein HYQ46_003712 [Verticillium longisporum]